MLIHHFSQLVLSLFPMLFSLTKMKFPPTWLWMSHDYNRPKCIEPRNRLHPKSLTLLTYITYFEAFRELWFIWMLTVTVMSSLDIDVVCDNKLYGVNVSQVFSLFFSPVSSIILNRFPPPWQLLDSSLIISCISKALTHNSFICLNNMTLTDEDMNLMLITCVSAFREIWVPLQCKSFQYIFLSQ